MILGLFGLQNAKNRACNRKYVIKHKNKLSFGIHCESEKLKKDVHKYFLKIKNALSVESENDFQINIDIDMFKLQSSVKLIISKTLGILKQIRSL